MVRPTALTVTGLFGTLNHHVAVQNDARVTILTGPNGAGKTHVLNLLRGMVGLDFHSLLDLPFESARLLFENQSILNIEMHEAGVRLEVRGRHRGTRCGSFEVHVREQTPNLPPWVTQLGPDLYRDDREYRNFTRAAAMRRFGPVEPAERPDWLDEFRPSADPVMIATGRLDTPVQDDDYVPRPARKHPEAVARIVQYAEQIERQVSDARRNSLARSQKADRGFAVRALDKARATIQESVLRSRYAQISALNQQLASNSLTEETVEVAIPAGRTNPTERRILNLFLDDWEEKLAPLVPVHQRLQLLREIVGEKMTNKSLRIGKGGELIFLTPNGEQINVDMLSSGEQHLLALYTMLLFSAVKGSLVLIDEPEISLHAAWKHAFLNDIERVAELNDLQVVLATHSTGIVNGRWELVEEIGVSTDD